MAKTVAHQRAERAERERDAERVRADEHHEQLRLALADNDRLREALQAATGSLGYVLFRCRQMGLDVGRDVSGESWLKPFTGAMKGEYEVLERARAALSADAEPSNSRAHTCSEWDDLMGWCERKAGHVGTHERVNGLGVTVRWSSDG